MLMHDKNKAGYISALVAVVSLKHIDSRFMSAKLIYYFKFYLIFISVAF